jgi:hypothetical protein
MTYCSAITYAGIKEIIEHCKELCYLRLNSMDSLTEVDMNTLYDQLLKTGKQVDHPPPIHDGYYDFDHCFKITNKIKA